MDLAKKEAARIAAVTAKSKVAATTKSELAYHQAIMAKLCLTMVPSTTARVCWQLILVDQSALIEQMILANLRLEINLDYSLDLYSMSWRYYSYHWIRLTPLCHSIDPPS